MLFRSGGDGAISPEKISVGVEARGMVGAAARPTVRGGSGEDEVTRLRRSIAGRGCRSRPSFV